MAWSDGQMDTFLKRCVAALKNNEFYRSWHELADLEFRNHGIIKLSQGVMNASILA